MPRKHRANQGLKQDPFAVLGLPLGADDTAVRIAYRNAVREHSPERDPEGFKAVREAYEALRDPVARAETILFRRPVLPDLEGDLAQIQVEPPALEEILSDLWAIAVEGTDLGRTAFPEDLREIAE